MHKTFLLLALLFVVSGLSYAQSFRGTDRSPMDMAYFPDNFAHDRKEGEKEWTIIFNSDLDYWGAYSYNETNDVIRLTVPVTALNNVVEAFTIQFEDKGNKQGAMWLAWDQTAVEVPFQY